MLKVLTARHPLEARLIEALLESHGIAVEIRGEALYGTVDGGTYVPSLLPTVWVIDDSQAPEADDLILRFFKGASTTCGDESWACPQCAEVHEPQFTSCWQCSTSKPIAEQV